MRFHPPPEVLSAIARLNGRGFEAYLVGGCVRDAYLGRVPEDYDLATQALPAQMREAFFPLRTLDTGLQHGTLTLLTDGHAIEVTTFRSDGRYSDGRHPDAVRFTASLEEDLKRRDFTANAMAWHPETGIVDPFSGRADCDRRRLRAVGEPGERFREDALRILRALRFACQLGFDIEPETLRAMEEAKERLRLVSFERVGREINLALTGESAAGGFSAYPQVLLYALPELRALVGTAGQGKAGPWQTALRLLGALPREPAPRWAALFLFSAPEPGQCATLLAGAQDRLRQPRAPSEEAVLLVRHALEKEQPGDPGLTLYRLGVKRGLSLLRFRLALARARHAGGSEEARRAQAMLDAALRLVDEGACLGLKDLAVKGEDLLALGFPRDGRMAKALDSLMLRVLRGETENDREALMEKARSLLGGGEPETR